MKKKILIAFMIFTTCSIVPVKSYAADADSHVWAYRYQQWLQSLWDRLSQQDEIEPDDFLPECSYDSDCG